MIQTADYDAIVLDIVLPDTDGFSLCRRLRDQGIWTPVLMLTARNEPGDRIRGLDIGADDYLGKPFLFDELLARLRALVRRGQPERPTALEVGDLRLDPALRQVTRAGQAIDLSVKEFALLEVFMRRPDWVLSRDDLLRRAWDLGYEAGSNVVDVYVSRLRAKIDQPFGIVTLETVRGAGYRLRTDATAPCR